MPFKTPHALLGTSQAPQALEGADNRAPARFGPINVGNTHTWALGIPGAGGLPAAGRALKEHCARPRAVRCKLAGALGNPLIHLRVQQAPAAPCPLSASSARRTLRHKLAHLREVPAPTD